MAGLGSRFRKAGYSCPKYMINAKGRTLFYWSLLSLQSFDFKNAKFMFIVRKEDHAKLFINEQCDLLGIKNRNIIQIDKLTDGQASSVLYAKDSWDAQSPLLVYNIDTYVEPEFLVKNTNGDSGWIPCFKALGESWSFVKLDKQGNVVEVREKKRISDHCTIGLYWFETAILYAESYKKYYAKPGREEKGERYIAPLYNQLIENGYKVTISIVPESKVHLMGTPEELDMFILKLN